MTANRVPETGERWQLRFEMDEPDGVVVVSTGLEGEILGIASAGPTCDQDAPTQWELGAINEWAAHHGTGVADALISAVYWLRRPTRLLRQENTPDQAV